MLCCCKNVKVKKFTNNHTIEPEYTFCKMKFATHSLHSTIYMCEESKTKTKCICKQINLHRNTMNEINILKKLKNSNSGYFPKYMYHKKIDKSTVSLYYEYIPGKDLFQTFFQDFSMIPKFEKVIDLAKNMLYCVIELQKYNLMHIDIKLENFIFDMHNNKLYLIDFEGCQKIPPGNRIGNIGTFLTTKNYVPPEIWFKIGHKNTDIWNIGICLWLLLTRQYPFYTSSVRSTILLYKNSTHFKKYDQFTKKMEYDIIKKCKVVYKFPTNEHSNQLLKIKNYNKLLEMFAQIFTLEPNDRITAKQLLKMISNMLI